MYRYPLRGDDSKSSSYVSAAFRYNSAFLSCYKRNKRTGKAVGRFSVLVLFT